jgi:Tetratricopeptide repeat
VRDDDDLRVVLPEPPPPAPKPRDAAIAAALARFDGGPTPARIHRPEPTPWWKTLRGPQVGLIAATALVAAISLPFALQPPVPPVPKTTTDKGVAPGTNNAASSGRNESAEVPAAIQAATQPAARTNAVGIDPPSSQSYTVAPIPPPIEMAKALPAPPPPPAPLAMREELPSAIVVQGRAISQIQQDTAVAISVVSSEEISDDEDDGSVVVTGSRRSRENPVKRGDWNACTVNDPKRAPGRCRTLARKAPKAVRSQTEIHLSDGLKQAWNGDLDKAISAFDAAIALAPDLTAAYLNRGLVYDWQGKREAAIADLNRAVLLSPKLARVYYNRSVLLRKYGDSQSADDDEQQAINLDPLYHAILQ